MGPLVDEGAVNDMMAALEKVRAEGGEILHGGNRLDRPASSSSRPSSRRTSHEDRRGGDVRAVLYVYSVASLDEAIALQNSLSRASRRRSSRQTSSRGDVPLAEAPTAASPTSTWHLGRRSEAPSAARRRPRRPRAGSDSWKQYMRRQTARSTTPASCRWRRASSSRCDEVPVRARGRPHGIL